MDSFWDVIARLMDNFGLVVVFILIPLGQAVAVALRKRREQGPAPRQRRTRTRTTARSAPPPAPPPVPPPVPEELPLPWMQESYEAERGWTLHVEPAEAPPAVSLEVAPRAVTLEKEPQVVSLERQRVLHEVGQALPAFASSIGQVEREYGERLQAIGALARDFDARDRALQEDSVVARVPAARWRPRGGWREAMITQEVLREPLGLRAP